MKNEKIIDLKCRNPRVYNGYLVPCGKCLWCKQRRAENWIFRLNREFYQHDSSVFVTLTYDDTHLPRDSDNVPILVKKDVQNYFRYLRRNGLQFKYFIVGEYGPTTFRPHFHLLLFGVSHDSLDILCRCWSKGFISVYNINGGSINYVSRYSLINSSLPDYLLTKERKPFMLCSKGIGIAYVDDDMKSYHQATKRTFVVDNGYKKSMPRYYKTKLFTDEQLKDMSQEWQDKTNEHVRELIVLSRKDETFADVYSRLMRKEQLYKDFEQKVLRDLTKKAKV